jgi:hypothetical protein
MRETFKQQLFSKGFAWTVSNNTRLNHTWSGGKTMKKLATMPQHFVLCRLIEVKGGSVRND